MEDKRAYRADKKTVVYVVYKKDGETLMERSAAGQDISQGGMKLSLPKNIAKGEEVDLKIHVFSDPIPVSIKGKIVWSGKKAANPFSDESRENDEKNIEYLTGIEFINIDQFTRERILRWVNEGMPHK